MMVDIGCPPCWKICFSEAGQHLLALEYKPEYGPAICWGAFPLICEYILCAPTQTAAQNDPGHARTMRLQAYIQLLKKR
jgi:hypothetical protein